MKKSYRMKIVLVVAGLFLVFIVGRGIKATNAQAIIEGPKMSSGIPIDEFEYDSDEGVRKVWTVVTSSGATVELDMDTAVPADPEFKSTKSLKVHSYVPAAAPRYEQIMFLFEEEDWSDNHYIDIWVKGDGVEAEPWGGEFSVCLIDAGSGEDEVWQSTRWFDRKSGWKKITISLTGSGQGNPWDHAKDFVIPDWEKVRNGVLDKDKIKGVMIKSLVTEEFSKKFPHFIVWIDHLARY